MYGVLQPVRTRLLPVVSRKIAFNDKTKRSSGFRQKGGRH
jgi:hypothetical protein